MNHFFADASLRFDNATLQRMTDIIAAIESVIALPSYQSAALAQAPEIARLPAPPRGVFMGYDFHITATGPKLIEINTNAGGGLLNAELLAARGYTAQADAVRAAYVAMFREEWRLQKGDQVLRRIAIVDDAPQGQFLAPEFDGFRSLFMAHGIDAVVCDPCELAEIDGRLCHDGKPIDLIYNRLTDFALDATGNQKIRRNYENGSVVLTPHPRAHALYADKRNLMLLTDDAALIELGVEAATRNTLLAGIPRVVTVVPEQGEAFWAERKGWFFKPPAGFGSRAAYRGDKLTKRVFEEILHGGYIAQEIALPSEHPVPVDGGEETMKADIRCYVYNGTIQLVAARLYQGQTTNFRTPGGGFAPVFFA